MLNTQPTILGRLRSADREHQKEVGGRVLLRNLQYVWMAFLAAFVLDVALHLSGGWRLGLLLLILVGASVLASVGWHIAYRRRSPLERVARLLEDRDPALGSRLINLIQLEAQTSDGSLSPLTHDLARRAIGIYAEELQSIPLETLGRTGEVSRQLRRAAWGLLLFAAILAAGFRVTAVELARFVDPFGDHPPYSFTRLAIFRAGTGGRQCAFWQGFDHQGQGHRPPAQGGLPDFLPARPPRKGNHHPDVRPRARRLSPIG